MEVVYRIQFTEVADEDIAEWKHLGNVSAMRKISRLLNELERHPFSGTGKPEQLRYEYSGFWSRRIDSKNRIIYEVDDVNRIIVVHSLMGHYYDK